MLGLWKSSSLDPCLFGHLPPLTHAALSGLDLRERSRDLYAKRANQSVALRTLRQSLNCAVVSRRSVSAPP